MLRSPSGLEAVQGDDLRHEPRPIQLELALLAHEHQERLEGEATDQRQVDPDLLTPGQEVVFDLLGILTAQDPVPERDEHLPEALDHAEDEVTLRHLRPATAAA